MQEEQLLREYWNTIVPFFSSSFEELELAGKGGVRLRGVRHEVEGAEAALLVLGGRTEFAEKYAELFYDLRGSNLSLYSLDHRGQGLSARLLADRHKGHVANFHDYLADLRVMLEEVIVPRHRRVVVLGHSMGGAIAALYEILHPGSFAGLILSSPMLGINCRPLSQRLTDWVARSAVAMGRGGEYIVGGKPYREVERFAGNVFTSSRVRLEINQELVRRTPQLALGGPTNQWLREALRATREIAAAASAITAPLLLLQSGADRVVTASSQRYFCAQVASARLEVIPEARHELLMERDEMRATALAVIGEFLAGPLSD